MNAIGTSAGRHGDDAGRVRAVIYARAARVDSINSIESQCEEVRSYAAINNLDVIRVYADIGKSGSSIDGRDEMKRLLADVANPDRDFDVILIYDRSRWGRSLDASDAYHEYLCRRAGVEIRVCNEPPADDGCSIRQMAQRIRRVVAGYYRIRFPRKRDNLRVPSAPKRRRIGGRRPWKRIFRGQI